ncbi:tripartite motif-containing protein 59-like [Gracilinanus agilis]|uniref:tripartite motif-containing protein 59-like n=1 Tax=Gracilinanus agilis TaxID=191870 RepID=UPI001CFCC000|nr:tripartite motif-containing protein 59-like [Gracilinanus agilis]
MHNFEEELTCSICYSIFEDPRVLPCSHTFCRNCLENVLQSSGNFYVRRAIRISLTCPNCRSIIEIPPPGIESLPINFALRAIIEKYQQEEHPDVITCPEHSSQPLNVYCLQDRQPVCGHCLTIGQHRGHPIEDLLSAYMKVKEKAPELFELFSDGHWEDFWLFIEKLKEHKSHLEQVVQSDKETVHHYFKELNDILELKKDALLSALDDIGKAIDEEYTPQIERMKEIREEQIELKSLTGFLIEEESPLKFLEKFHNVRQRVQALKQRELPNVQTLEICPRVGAVLKEEWARTEISQIKNLVVPEIKLSSQMMQCVPAKEEEKEEEKKVEFAKIFSIFILTVISGMLMLIFLFNRHTLPILHNVSSGYFSEVSQSLYHSFFNNMYTVKETVCLTYHTLEGFLWDIISCL